MPTDCVASFDSRVRRSSVQRQFATKDDLWRAAVDHLREETIQRRGDSE